jgi:hypothetical protein
VSLSHGVFANLAEAGNFMDDVRRYEGAVFAFISSLDLVMIDDATTHLVPHS